MLNGTMVMYLHGELVVSRTAHVFTFSGTESYCIGDTCSDISTWTTSWFSCVPTALK